MPPGTGRRRRDPRRHRTAGTTAVRPRSSASRCTDAADDSRSTAGSHVGGRDVGQADRRETLQEPLRVRDIPPDRACRQTPLGAQMLPEAIQQHLARRGRRTLLNGVDDPEVSGASPAGTAAPDATSSNGTAQCCVGRPRTPRPASASDSADRSARSRPANDSAEPPAATRYDRTPRRVAAPSQRPCIRGVIRSQRPRHHHLAHPARWSGPDGLLPITRKKDGETRTLSLCRPLRGHHLVPQRHPRRRSA